MSKNATAKKPQRVEAIYSQHAEFTVSDVEKELGIEWSDVEYYDIRHGILRLEMKWGLGLEYHGIRWGSMDTKEPDEVWEYGEGFSKNTVPNWRCGCKEDTSET